jgi:hypothetical protein
MWHEESGCRCHFEDFGGERYAIFDLKVLE